MRPLFLWFLFFLWPLSSHAQVPFHFILRYHQPDRATYLTAVLQSPDGRTDTLFRGTLKSTSNGIRNMSKGGSTTRRVDRKLSDAGDYRLILLLDTVATDLPFTLKGDELMVEAGLYVTSYDTSKATGYPNLNVFRQAPKGVTLYYLGTDTLQHKLLFHLVNHSDDTIYDGNRNVFLVDVQQYVGEEPADIQVKRYSDSPSLGPLLPGRSHKLYVDDWILQPGRHRAAVTLFTDRHDVYCPVGTIYSGLIGHADCPSILWLNVGSRTVYVATCDIFLTTIDLDR